MTDPTDKSSPDQLSTSLRNSSRGRVAGAIALVAGIAALTAIVVRWTQSRPSPPPSFPFVQYPHSSECTIHYNNVGWGPQPELYVERAGVQYFRQIDGEDIGELVKRMETK